MSDMPHGWWALRGIICEENDRGGTILLVTLTVTSTMSIVRGGVGGGVFGGTPPISTRDGLESPVIFNPTIALPQSIYGLLP